MSVTTSSRSAAPAFIAAIVTLLFWGGTAIANRYAVGYADPIAVATLRSLLAGLLALSIALLLRLEFPAERKDRILLLLSGLFSFALWPIVLSLGLGQTTASHAALIMAILPVITVLLAALINRTVPTAAWWFGGTLAIIATVFLITDRGGSFAVADPAAAAIGDLIILAGCVFCAAGYVAGAKVTAKIGSFATTFWGLATALLVTVPGFLLTQAKTDWAALPASAWWAIAWLTLCSSFFGYVLWFYALGRGGIERIGSLQLLMPVVTLVGAVLILGEVLTWQLAALCSIVLLGTFIAHRYSTRE